VPKYLTLKEAFDKCRIEGKFIPRKGVDTDKIKSMVEIALADLESGKEIKKTISKQSKQWSTVYKLHYDVLHELVEAFLHFDNIKSDNHQCLFAYLCEKHPKLELDWDFFEKVKTKRNGINYYGIAAMQEDWKEIEVQIYLYINVLKKEIKKRIGVR